MSEPFPAIAEAAATGETAMLVADIRISVGVRVVSCGVSSPRPR